jgi:hypothetical protein
MNQATALPTNTATSTTGLQETTEATYYTSATELLTGEGNVRTEQPQLSDAVRDQLDDLRAIYGEPSDSLQRVIESLTEAIEFCKEALVAKNEGNGLAADDNMAKAQITIAGLINHRKAGQGFDIVIGALTLAFTNKAGIPLRESEILAVLQTMNQLRNGPFSSVEKAVAITETLENAGLVVDPLPLTDLLMDAEEAGLVES